MKKHLNFGVLVMVMLALCINLSSCSDDDDEDSFNTDFYEFSVDGKTYKESYIGLGASIQIGNVTMQYVCQTQTSTHNLDVRLSVPKYEKDISDYMQPSKYNIIALHDYSKAKTFDLLVDYSNNSETDDSYYFLQSATKYNITEVKFLEKEDGMYYYTVSGNFACTFENTSTHKEVTVEGKFRVTVIVSE
ncbi:MAG: hypothetical protein ACK5L7_01460 [Paludibacteraceae bacterium]